MDISIILLYVFGWLVAHTILLYIILCAYTGGRVYMLIYILVFGYDNNICKNICRIQN